MYATYFIWYLEASVFLQRSNQMAIEEKKNNQTTGQMTLY